MSIACISQSNEYLLNRPTPLRATHSQPSTPPSRILPHEPAVLSTGSGKSEPFRLAEVSCRASNFFYHENNSGYISLKQLREIVKLNGLDMVVIGLDEKNVDLEVLSMLGSRGYIPRQEFLERRNDYDQAKRYIHAGIFIKGKEPAKHPLFMYVG